MLDLFARRVIGWAMADHLRTGLVSAALLLAVGRRLPPATVVHHSDRGAQYASAAYQQLLRAHGIVGSMSRAGNCWGNAVVESFFATLKAELIDRRSWPTRAEVRVAISDYLERFCNGQRLHSYLNYRTPVEAEKEFMANCCKSSLTELSTKSGQDPRVVSPSQGRSPAFFEASPLDPTDRARASRPANSPVHPFASWYLVFLQSG